jgi:hypothetical protein
MINEHLLLNSPTAGPLSEFRDRLMECGGSGKPAVW